MAEETKYGKVVTVSKLGHFKTKQDAANEAKFLKLANTKGIGSATKPVYFTADGVPAAGTYELNKTVPADAVFTDTTYADVTADSTGAADSGLMTSSDKAKVDGIAAGAQANVIEGIKVGDTALTLTDKVATLGTAAGAASESTLTDGANLPTGAAVKSFVEGKGYQTASDVEGAINAKIATAMDYKGTKETVAALPSSGNKAGDVWHVTADGSEYAWDGSEWQELGVTFDATGYVQSSDISLAEDADIDALFA